MATNGALWTSHSNWLSGTVCPSGNWFGVTCSGSAVVKLDLNDNNIQGILPTELGLLTTIESYFRLQSNAIYGTIPSKLLGCCCVFSWSLLWRGDHCPR